MLNVSTQMGFENRELLKNTARTILQSGSGASEKAASAITESIFSGTESNVLPQSLVLRASTQITLSNSLKETLKYLQAHANDKRKAPVFGELLQVTNVTNDESQENPYKGELLDFEISKDAKNIFAA